MGHHGHHHHSYHHSHHGHSIIGDILGLGHHNHCAPPVTVCHQVPQPQVVYVSSPQPVVYAQPMYHYPTQIPAQYPPQMQHYPSQYPPQYPHQPYPVQYTTYAQPPPNHQPAHYQPAPHHPNHFNTQPLSLIHI
eukprot:TRINITY_DN7474_c0_g1_i1.p1 TRINITY_DN7474_c0_g1~~TRINITY_DN7474_c0_g1_i1.p1  ORF type:complete len:151 (+),score=23.68 TRINITY_DN7474_c0_g1_i1:53-454(+)